MLTNHSKAVLIPGFLGTGEDLGFFRPLFKECHVIDPCGSDAPSIGEDWSQWLVRVVERIQAFASAPPQSQPVLIGYSLGARLAMSLLDKCPSLFSAAVLLSPNPGVLTDSEREQRLVNDQQWGARFVHEDWHVVTADWNAQPVFLGSTNVERNAAQFDTQRLARVLDVFSVARQSNFCPISLPSIILYGTRDPKAAQYVPTLQKIFTDAEIVEVPDAGHRVYLDKPERCFRTVKDFFRSTVSERPAS